MIERLDFSEFSNAVDTIISEKLGCLYDVRLMKVIKNNGLCLQGLCIRSSNHYIAPTIYLNDYFEDYVNGRDVTDIVLDILQVYQNSNIDMPSIDNDFSWEHIQKNVILRLINYDMNKELLQGVPHKIKFEDLAITFHVLTGSTKDGVQSYRISNEIFNSFGIDLDVLYESALHNTMSYFPTSLRNMSEVIVSMMTSEGLDSEEYAELFDTTAPEEGRGIMYVLTNSIGVYGATAMLYSDIIKEFADTLETDIYILPSSLHEVILLLDYGRGCSGGELKNMVSDVNKQVLDIDDILSDSVYKYCRSSNKIEKL